MSDDDQDRGDVCEAIGCGEPVTTVAEMGQPDDASPNAHEWRLCRPHFDQINNAEPWLYDPPPKGDGLHVGAAAVAQRGLVKVDDISLSMNLMHDYEHGRIQRIVIEGRVWGNGEPQHIELLVDRELLGRWLATAELFGASRRPS